MGQPVGECLSIHAFHGEVEDPVSVSGVEHGNRIWVAEPCRGTGFTDETRPVDLGDPAVSNELDRQLAMKAKVVGGIHLGHRAAAESDPDRVATGDRPIHRCAR